jgi:hypothetical protein
MKKRLLALAMFFVLAGVSGYNPTAAWGWGGEEIVPLGDTIETVAVTAPVTVGGITYLPCNACGGGAATVPLGTVPTSAVTAPVTVGDITYIPRSTCYFCGPWPW